MRGLGGEGRVEAGEEGEGRGGRTRGRGEVDGRQGALLRVRNGLDELVRVPEDLVRDLHDERQAEDEALHLLLAPHLDPERVVQLVVELLRAAARRHDLDVALHDVDGDPVGLRRRRDERVEVRDERRQVRRLELGEVEPPARGDARRRRAPSQVRLERARRRRGRAGGGPVVVLLGERFWAEDAVGLGLLGRRRRPSRLPCWGSVVGRGGRGSGLRGRVDEGVRGGRRGFAVKGWSGRLCRRAREVDDLGERATDLLRHVRCVSSTFLRRSERQRGRERTHVDGDVRDHLLVMRQVHLGTVAGEVVSSWTGARQGCRGSLRGGRVRRRGRRTHSSDWLETISAPRTSTKSCVPAGDGSCESSMDGVGGRRRGRGKEGWGGASEGTPLVGWSRRVLGRRCSVLLNGAVGVLARGEAGRGTRAFVRGDEDREMGG